VPTYGITALAEIHAGIVVTSRGGYVAIESSWECGDKTYIVAIKGTRTGWRSGRPTRTKIEELHRTWFERGTPLIVDLTK